MIIVTGASGKLGQHVIKELLKKVKPTEIIAAVRNPAKAGDLKALGVVIRQADYERPETLTAAFAGVKKVLLISSSEVGKREAQHKAVIEAARAARVEQLAYTGILNSDKSTLGLAREHQATEKAILESGIPYTFLRNGWYFENQTENLGSALEHGVILGAAGEGRFASASRADYAAAAAAVLVVEGHKNKIYELGGDSSFSLSELAVEVAKQSHKTVVYKNLPQAEYAKALIGFGLPHGLAELLADSDAGAARGELDTHSKDLSKLIGRATTTLTQAVRAFI